MENVFSAAMDIFNERKRVPKSLDECRAVDTTSSALNRWAGTVMWGTIAIAAIIILLGLFVATEAEEFWVFLPFGIFGWIVIAIGEFITNLIRGLASIVYNTGITANVALMNAKQGEDAADEEPSRPPVHIKQTSKEVSKLEDALYE